jgi:ABC-type antimicrobial peptide transport system permease subunit
MQQLFYHELIVPQNLKAPSENVIQIKFNVQLTKPEMFFAFRKSVLNETGLEFLGSYRNEGIIVIEALSGNSELKKLNDKLIKGMPSHPGQLLSLSFEKGVQNLKSLKIVKGRNFLNEDFNRDNHIIPILAGYELIERGIVSIGSEIIESGVNKKYIVVGQLGKNSSWFLNSPSEGRLRYLDNMLVIPLNDNDYLYGMINPYFYGIIKNSTDIEKSIGSINKIAKKMGLEIKTQTIREQMEISKKDNINNNSKLLIFSIFFLFMTSFGTATTMLSTIILRKEEIGIRCSVGYSIKLIQKLFAGEILFINIISTLCAVIVGIININFDSRQLYGAVNDGYFVTPTIVALAFGIAIIISIFPLTTVMNKIKKIQPIELIGGKD